MTDKASAIRPDMVRELEWIDEAGNGASWVSDGLPWETYRVFTAWWGKQGKWGFVCTDSDDQFFHTMDEAKAAAQADYASRIASALSPAFIERMAALEAENEPAPPNPNIEEFLRGVVGSVEATNAEYHNLWEYWHSKRGKQWDQINSGLLPIVGRLAGMPICISLMKATVDGNLLLFWHATSQIVDHRAIEAWLEASLPDSARWPDGRLNRTDAMNFHNIFRAPLARHPERNDNE